MSSDEIIKQDITAIMILEVMGRPKEHLIETLEDLIKKVGEEKGVTIIEKKLHEPTEVKDQKDLFTTYAEVEVEVEQALQLAILMFTFGSLM